MGGMRIARVVAVAVALIVTVSYGATVLTTGFGTDWGIGVSVLATGLLGALLILRQPKNQMGWVFALAGIAGTLAFISLLGGDSYWWLVSGSLGWWTWLYATYCLVPLRFPSGRISSRRMQWVGVLGWAVLGGMLALGLLAERLCVESIEESCVRWLDNPIGINGVQSAEEGLVGSLLLVGLTGAAIAAVISLLARYRRVPDVERHQIKWLLYFVGLQIMWLVTIDGVAANLLGYELPDSIYDPIVGALWLGIPVAAGIAIFKYRLYEIDRIVSRTVTYALVIGLLVAAYAGGIALLTDVVPLEGNLAVAASTLAVAALFNPLRWRVQRVVERRFNRARYNSDLTVGLLTDRLRNVTDVPELPRPAGGPWLPLFSRRRCRYGSAKTDLRPD